MFPPFTKEKKYDLTLQDEPVCTSPSNEETCAEERRSSDESDIPLLQSGVDNYQGSKKRRGFLGIGGRRGCKMSSALKQVFSRPLMIANVLVLQILVGIIAYHWHNQHMMNAKLKEVSLHSPLLDRVNIPLAARKSYAQYGMGGPEIWRSEPSEEVDRAWERVTAEYIFPVKKSDITAMRKDPSTVVPMPDKPEYYVDGERTYLAKSAVFHNIHCLDYVRKAVYKDYYYPNGTDDNPFHAYHTAHCIMVLFEHLTCSGDPGVYLYQWMDEFNRPIADTNIWRQCWDFETVLEEHDEAAIHDMTETDLRKPPGVKTVPAPDGVMNIINGYRKAHPDYNPGQ